MPNSPAAADSLRVDSVVSFPFDENAYIVWLEGRTDCVVFDPGLQPKKIIDLVESHGLTPAAILITHGHTDHIAGNAGLKERWPQAPLVIGEREAPKLTDPELNLSAKYGFDLRSPPADRTVVEGETCSYAGIEFRVLDTPGHSSGHVTFVAEVAGVTHAFAGDVLFRGSIGRTDFPDGDFETLREAIHTRLFPLPDDTVVYPGHGPTTTVGLERRTNPFVGTPAGYAV